jgi:drug/metabolite transporter (DMT)-like permease
LPVRTYDFARLIALAAMWSLQYLFMRVAVPALGFGLVAEFRALSAALFLLPAAIMLGQPARLHAHGRVYFRVALVNNVLPFLCFAFAAASLPAGYLSIINGTVPMWTALFAAWLLHEPLGGRRIVGFALGIAGVVMIVQLGPVALDARVALGAFVGLIGAAFWGWGGVMIKQCTGEIPAIALAAGSISYSALILSPAWTGASTATWSLAATASAIALGVIGSGIAYLAFFTLVRDIGPSRTLSVTFLIPVLGVLWGWLLLDETVTLSMILGGVIVVAALGLVIRR